MKILLLTFLLSACGTQTIKAKGGTTNKVDIGGEAKILVGFDISACREFTSEEAQLKCLDLLIELTAVLRELKDQEVKVSGDEI